MLNSFRVNIKTILTIFVPLKKKGIYTCLKIEFIILWIIRSFYAQYIICLFILGFYFIYYIFVLSGKLSLNNRYFEWRGFSWQRGENNSNRCRSDLSVVILWRTHSFIRFPYFCFRPNSLLNSRLSIYRIFMNVDLRSPSNYEIRLNLPVKFSSQRVEDW